MNSDSVEVNGVTPEEIMLRWKEFRSQSVVRREDLVALRPELRVEHLNFMFDELVLRLSSMALTDTLVDSERTVVHHFTCPSSPWQHFKLKHGGAWWMRWLTRRRPPILVAHSKSTTVSFKSEAMFPHSGYYPESLGKPVVFQTMRETDWSDQ